ncbi:uncharacterized protein PgNI_00165 [Pyricularia grisea]|uniref:Uncharacterized protein n=1 Tax=Pyricularia grisea TaxID=148305 RepID=A0A6P8BIR4_PYRGI|nr:uncharacterized protein PgNI_00165 [Pyricularia grisea]TLD16776.1 hypothetical protein PgNI_00165 [Pyricularia grisea]
MPSVTPNASPVTDETNTPQLQKLTIDPKTFLHEIPSINKKHPLNPYRQTQIPLTSPKPSKILDIIHRYKLTTRPGSYDLTVNGFKVLSQICARITANQHISMSAIKDVYPLGSALCIISDGLVYNYLLGAPDRDIWNYGNALCNMLGAASFRRIEFSRPRT